MASDVLQTIVYDIEISDSDTKGIQKTNQQVKNMGSLFETASKHAKTLFAGFAAKKVVEFTLSVASASEQLNIAKNTFKNFSKESGRDFNELMDSMRAASGNTLTDIEILAKANVAKLFKIQTPIDQLIELTRETAKIKGDSLDFIFNKAVEAIGKKSRQIADELGIIVKQTEAEEQAARKLGVTVDQLTKAQKDRAFEMAVIAGLQENIARSGIESTTTIAEVGKKIGVVYTKLKDVLGQSILPIISKAAQSVSSILDDFLLILEQSEKESVRQKITEQEKKRNDLIAERLVILNKINDAKAAASGLLNEKEIEQARTLLMNSRFGERLDQNKVNALTKIVELEDARIAKTNQIRKAIKDVTKIKEEERKKSNDIFINRKKTAESMKAEKETIIKIQVEREKLAAIEAKKPAQLEALKMLEEQLRIASIEDEKQKIIEINKFEFEQQKKKFDALGKEELKRLEAVSKGKLEKQLSDLDERLKGDEEGKKTGLETTTEEMSKNVIFNLDTTKAALETFGDASTAVMQNMIKNNEFSLKNLKNIWFEMAASRLTAIAVEASTLALFSTAEGFLTGNPGYFTAAGIYAQAALAAGAGAAILNKNISGRTKEEPTSKREKRDRSSSLERESQETKRVTIINKGVMIKDTKELSRLIMNETKDDNRRTNFNFENTSGNRKF